MIYFISDLHEGDKNIIKYCNRPFNDIDQQWSFIKENWNKTVRHNDTVYILGDAFWNTVPKSMVRDKLNSLNGKKILIKGNHDSGKITFSNARSWGFEAIYHELKIKINKNYMVKLSHYPYRPHWLKELKCSLFYKLGIYAWDFKHKDKRPKNEGTWLIHGHTHSEKRVSGKQINVSVEAWNYTPVSINQIISIMEEEQ